MNRWNFKDPEKGGLIKQEWISGSVDQHTVDFAHRFGDYLAKPDKEQAMKNGRPELDNRGKPKMAVVGDMMTTSQLRRFFGEVKRQQIIGYEESSFVMLSPKLAYAVGRAKKDLKPGMKYSKLEDFFTLFDDAIKKVGSSSDKQMAFRNFIAIFEAIVAYHKAAE